MTHEELQIANNTVLGLSKQRRSEGRLHTYVRLYGTQHYYISTKIKKGAVKGQYRLQKIKNKFKNSVDNLNWLK